MSGIPEADLARIARWCGGRVPSRARHQGRVEHTVRGSSVDIVERRAPFVPERGPEWTSMRVAQLRYDAASGQWSLFFSDRNDRLHDYRDAAQVGPRLIDVLAEIDDDPTCIFWG